MKKYIEQKYRISRYDVQIHMVTFSLQTRLQKIITILVNALWPYTLSAFPTEVYRHLVAQQWKQYELSLFTVNSTWPTRRWCHITSITRTMSNASSSDIQYGPRVVT